MGGVVGGENPFVSILRRRVVSIGGVVGGKTIPLSRFSGATLFQFLRLCAEGVLELCGDTDVGPSEGHRAKKPQPGEKHYCQKLHAVGRARGTRRPDCSAP
jgi:hypothetical protein